MAVSQHTTRRALIGGASGVATIWSKSPASSHDCSVVVRLDNQLAELVGRYQSAEMAAHKIFQRIYPSGREAMFRTFGRSENDWSRCLEVYERETGYDAACESLDNFANLISEIVKQIIAIPAQSSDALSLKARACLWEAPSELLERGF